VTRAVDLHDEVLVGPIEVDLDAVDLRVDARLRACPGFEESILEGASGSGAA
jgi:hypothetical protein